MADESTTQTTTPEKPEGEEQKAPEAKSGEETEVVQKADNPDAVRNLIDREREARKAADRKAEELAAKVKEFEDAQKSEQEKLADERDSLKSEVAAAKAESLRMRVALAKKLPAELIDRLQGSTEEELAADADKLLALVKPADATDFDGGARTTSTEKSPEAAHADFVTGLLGAKQP